MSWSMTTAPIRPAMACARVVFPAPGAPDIWINLRSVMRRFLHSRHWVADSDTIQDCIHSRRQGEKLLRPAAAQTDFLYRTGRSIEDRMLRSRDRRTGLKVRKERIYFQE